MSSQWFEKALNMGRRDRNNEANNLDLTLKLGLPGVKDHPPSFTGTGHEGTYDYGTMASRGLDGGKAAYSYLPSNGGSSSLLLEKGNYPHNPGYMKSYGSSTTGFPTYPKDTFMNSFGQQIGSAYNNNSNAIMGCNPIVGNASLEIIVSSSSSSNSRKRGSPCYPTDDPNKRCMNKSCNANDTPMWRRGPLGPKTLCNACGIKYRKEEDRKKFREAAIKNMNNIIDRKEG